MRIWWGFSLSSVATLARKAFTKRALDLQDQASLLASRGLIFENWAEAHEHLEHIGYYRFTGYLRPFKIGGGGPDAENFRPGTTFELVHDRYVFDRKLRMLILEAVEKIEIAVRSSISNSLAIRHGPHWYLDPKLFANPNYAPREIDVGRWHAGFIDDLKKQIGHDDLHRRDVFIQHYYTTYDRPEMPPCWMVFEVISFGSISFCFKFLLQSECKDVCQKFGLSHQVLGSWLHSISYVRNLCAHHARVWNRVLTIRPVIPKARRSAFNGQNGHIFAALLMLQIMLRRIWGDNHWAAALRSLVETHPKIPLNLMGFPEGWVLQKEWGF
jgi:abortive infection bacteriophage resistance protein